MDRIRIRGGKPLKGEIPISGAKNAALKLMAASLLTADPLVLANVPRLADVRGMAELLVSFGVGVQVTMAAKFGEGDTMKLEAKEITSVFASYDMVRKMRASFQVLAPLLARMGEAKVSLPGGCAIGARPVELHLNALEAMGAQIDLAEGYVTAKAPGGLKGAEIVFPFVSVGATETAMMAATLAKGTTKIVNAAREPEISDLGNCLTAMGAEIRGLGSSEITVVGVEKLHGAAHRVMADRIEAGTYAIAAAIAGGEVELVGAAHDTIASLLSLLTKSGAEVATTPRGLKIHMSGGRPKSVDVTTAPYPGFPTDLQAQIMALMAVADGTSVVKEMIFENRFMHVPELARMGASVRIDGDTATVRGVEKLKGAQVMATDLRASVSLVLAGLVAEGETNVGRIYHLDRGFDRLEEKLSRVGADIERVSE
ncbi:MAG: UDP-N-acetylglucosamine 1-carboxyvinyltransferase [Alphaproteobacteria bacterium]|nr:UDP-N-acetylglucosamine 1-carboxyvinyltransferase [Alphaproteobacteria bacterium]